MMMPNIYRKSLFNDLFDGFFPEIGKGAFRDNGFGLMKTDIKEKDGSFELAIDMPGCKKEDVKAQIKDGYLIVNASTNSENEEKDKEGNFIRKERYSGTMSRSYYIGEDIQQEDIHAKFEDGILKISIPKQEPKKVEEPSYIAIEE